MTIPTPRQIVNASTAAAVTYCMIPNFAPKAACNAATVAVASAFLATPESQQLNARLATSVCGGTGLALKLLPENSSARSLAVTSLFATISLYLGQCLVEQMLTPTSSVNFTPASGILSGLNGGPQPVTVTAATPQRYATGGAP